MFWCVRCTLIGVISLAIAKDVGASWQVDHAFGDNAFTSAGTLIESVKASRRQASSTLFAYAAEHACSSASTPYLSVCSLLDLLCVL